MDDAQGGARIVIAAEPPPAAVAPAPPEPIVVSRRDGTELVATRDLPLTLTKAGRREDALLRQAVFVTAQITVVRPAEAEDALSDAYRWTYRSFLQRQVCFTSISGLFACSATELADLVETESGEAPLAEPDAFPAADAARGRLEAALKARATALFESDRRTYAEPLLKAGGVTVTRAFQPPPAGR